MDERDFQRNVLQAEGPVVVDFTARWCAPCRALSPMLEQLGAEHPTVRIHEIDVDEAPAVAQAYRILSVPTLIRFERGEPVRMQMGVDRASIEKLFEG